MKFGLTKRELIIRTAFFIAVAVLLVFFIRRLFFGMDIADEVLNICNSYRLMNGNHFLVDVWDYYQLGDSFLAPFVWIYVKLNGSAEGIVLACRLFYLGLTAVVGTVAYWVLKDYFSNFYARISVCFAVVFYAPFSMYYLWYDTAGQLFFLLGVLFLLKDLKSPARKWEIIAGLFHGFMVIAYPSALAIVMVELIFFFVVNRKRDKKHGNLFYILGGMIPVLLLVIYGITQKFNFYLFDNPVSNVNQTAETANVHYTILNENLSNLFSRGSTGIIAKIWDSVTSLFDTVSITKVGIVLVGLVMFIFVIRYSWKNKKDWITNSIFTAFGIVMPVLIWLFRGEYNRATIFAYTFLALLFIGALIAPVGSINKYSEIILLAGIPAIAFFPIVSITAAHGGTKAFMGLWVLCLLGLGMYLENAESVFKKAAGYIIPAVSILFFALVIFLFNNQYFEYEGNNSDMTYQVEQGVYKGLTIPEEYRIYIEIENEIVNLVDEDTESVAIFDEYPAFKYLTLGKKICMSESGRAFMFSEEAPMDYACFKTYWERFGHPDTIILKKDAKWYDEEMIARSPGCNYQKVRESEHYVVFENGK